MRRRFRWYMGLMAFLPLSVSGCADLKQTTLVREDLPIDDMLVTAVRYRPDLEAVRTLWAAAQADQGATVWGGLGPQVQAARTFLTPPPASAMVDTMYRQQNYVATGGFNWSAATFGRIKSAVANVKIAELDLDRELDQVGSAVVSAHQASLTAASSSRSPSSRSRRPKRRCA
jgi:outer membrane protein TolC